MKNKLDSGEEMVEWMRKTLLRQYGRTVYSAREMAGGWSATAFHVQTDKGVCFAKVYDKRRPSVQPWIARMASYMPAVLWLSGHTPLRERMVAPILTVDADYKAENAEYVLLVFPLVQGMTVGEARLPCAQIVELAETLALLHSYGAEIPADTASMRETHSLPFLEGLEEALDPQGMPPALGSVLPGYSPKIRRACTALRQLAGELRARPPAVALCHTDVHGWNLIWGERLTLIDWEGLLLAPVESDLFACSEGFFLGYARETFFAAYKAFRPGYTVHEPAMRYYRLRRRLADIAEFCDSIRHDMLAPAALEMSVSGLQRECAALEEGEWYWHSCGDRT